MNFNFLQQGYQITQQRQPLATGGHITFYVFIDGTKPKRYTKSCKLKQLQLEQDSGRSIYDETNKKQVFFDLQASLDVIIFQRFIFNSSLYRSYIDLNRAGIPLMELVFEPDLSNAAEAASLVKELTRILEKLDTCSCKFEGILYVMFFSIICLFFVFFDTTIFLYLRGSIEG